MHTPKQKKEDTEFDVIITIIYIVMVIIILLAILKDPPYVTSSDPWDWL